MATITMRIEPLKPTITTIQSLDENPKQNKKMQHIVLFNDGHYIIDNKHTLNELAEIYPTENIFKLSETFVLRWNAKEFAPQ